MPELTDIQRYDLLTRLMDRLKPFSKRWLSAWARLEKIKNRHGGMPPQLKGNKA